MEWGSFAREGVLKISIFLNFIGGLLSKRGYLKINEVHFEFLLLLINE